MPWVFSTIKGYLALSSLFNNTSTAYSPGTSKRKLLNRATMRCFDFKSASRNSVSSSSTSLRLSGHRSLVFCLKVPKPLHQQFIIYNLACTTGKETAPMVSNKPISINFPLSSRLTSSQRTEKRSVGCICPVSIRIIISV
jgi:hypothetical protein